MARTATFWSFENASAGSYTPYDGSKTYTATYLSARTVDYDDTKETDDPPKTRQVAAVTQDDMVSNINYVTEFYNVSSAQLDSIFTDILGEIMGQVFVPISGENDAFVENALTYIDPIGDLMEVKNQSILATPYHTDENLGKGETAVYDFQWNDAWMTAHNAGAGYNPLPMGWYKGEPKTADYDSGEKNNGLPLGCNSAAEAWAQGWVYRLDYKTVTKNTVYTIYRVDCTNTDRNKLRINPVYGDKVPQEALDAWAQYETKGDYPVGNELYADYAGVYRLSDIRVWVEEYGNYMADHPMTPSQAYDSALCLNVPTAAMPTQLATITLNAPVIIVNIGFKHKCHL